MIQVFILTAQMVGGWSMTPFADEAACQAAIAALSAAIVESGECYPIEMIAPSGSRYAPEMSPLPPRKPGQEA